MTTLRASLAAGLLVAAAAVAGADVLVLRGGSRIPIKGPILQQGQNILVTNTDGTLLSVPSAEVDLKATAAANAPQPAAPAAVPATAAAETPAEAARGARGPKARVRVTDADVSHQMDMMTSSSQPQEAKTAAGAATVGRVELMEYHQTKAGDQLVVNGMLRNPGTQTVNGVKLNVTALDENGKVLSASPANVAGSSVDPGRTLAFTATLPVGQVLVPILRFSPQWIPPPPPADKDTVAAAAAASKDQGSEAKPAGSSAESKPAAPQPTPYGRGTLYAPPIASAPTTAPADGKTGYIPGASSPENQPQPPK